jgi:molybdopterin biosynthesis enzyme MoaB
MIRARVITCSDAASRGEREDRSGPAVRELLVANGCDVDAVMVVADDIDAIAEASPRVTSHPRQPCGFANGSFPDSAN